MKKIIVLMSAILSVNCYAKQFNSLDEMQQELKENLIKIEQTEDKFEKAFILGRSEAIFDMLDWYDRWDLGDKVKKRQEALNTFKEEFRKE